MYICQSQSPNSSHNHHPPPLSPLGVHTFVRTEGIFATNFCSDFTLVKKLLFNSISSWFLPGLVYIFNELKNKRSQRWGWTQLTCQDHHESHILVYICEVTVRKGLENRVGEISCSLHPILSITPHHFYPEAPMSVSISLYSRVSNNMTKAAL